MITELFELRDALDDLDGVKTAKVGYEVGISPEDYPIARIVPTLATPGTPYRKRTVEVGIIFGAAIAESQGLEKVYEGLAELEGSIIALIKDRGHKYLDTLFDEDRLSTYKLMQVRCEVQTKLPDPN